MSMNDDRSDGPPEDSVLVGEFALGVLDAAEHERMARRIAAEPALRTELRMWQQRLAGLDSQFAEGERQSKSSSLPPSEGDEA